MIMQLLNFDWLANILAGLNFQAKENGLMSLDGVCAISTDPARHETKCLANQWTVILEWTTLLIVFFCIFGLFK